MGPTWPFLLMYESHNMRHTGFPQVDGGQLDPREMGRHNVAGEKKRKTNKEGKERKEGGGETENI